MLVLWALSKRDLASLMAGDRTGRLACEDVTDDGVRLHGDVLGYGVNVYA